MKKFPVIFAFERELLAETGSARTAWRTIFSKISLACLVGYPFAARREVPRISPGLPDLRGFTAIKPPQNAGRFVAMLRCEGLCPAFRVTRQRRPTP